MYNNYSIETIKVRNVAPAYFDTNFNKNHNNKNSNNECLISTAKATSYDNFSDILKQAQADLENQ